MKMTTNYKLKLPEKTDAFDVEAFNENASIIDQELQNLKTATDTSLELAKSNEAQIGDIKLSVVGSPGDDWLPCNGQILDKEEYSDLYNAMPTFDNRSSDDYSFTQSSILISNGNPVSCMPCGAIAVGNDGWIACRNTSLSKILFSQFPFESSISLTTTGGTGVWFCDNKYLCFACPTTGSSATFTITVYETPSNTPFIPTKSITSYFQSEYATSSSRIVLKEVVDVFKKDGFYLIIFKSTSTLYPIGIISLDENYELVDTCMLPLNDLNGINMNPNLTQFKIDTWVYCPVNFSENIITKSFYGLSNNNVVANVSFDYRSSLGLYYTIDGLFAYDSDSNPVLMYNDFSTNQYCLGTTPSTSVNGMYTFAYNNVTGEIIYDILPGFSISKNCFSILKQFRTRSDTQVEQIQIDYPNIPFNSTTKGARIVEIDNDIDRPCRWLLIINNGLIDSSFHFYVSDDLNDPYGWRAIELPKFLDGATLYPVGAELTPIVWYQNRSIYILATVHASSGNTQNSSKRGYLQFPFLQLPDYSDENGRTRYYIKVK